MQTAPFDYYRPETVAEAIDLLETVEGSRPLAGGHSLLPAMKLRVANPTAVVDLTRIEGLDGITRNGDSLIVGALAKHAAVAASELVQSDCSILADAAANIGDPAVRNRGTLGGSIAHADPAADYPTVLAALGATITVTGRSGDRSIPVDDYFVDMFTPAHADGELVTSVNVPVLGPGKGGAYRKHRHPASSYAVVGVAVVVAVEDGTCTEARIAVGGVTGKPERAEAAEAVLVGQPAVEEAIAAASSHVGEALGNPLGDAYASGEYRVHLAGVLTRRALADAFTAAGV
ncbi:MAG: xanthine dehydrogenase family protein subunit M [Acidimicrobiia bacterium]|nr:MAG: xanthine dehydrogenase family protein subunit M [Acidimicrobiia bacterium]